MKSSTLLSHLSVLTCILSPLIQHSKNVDTTFPQVLLSCNYFFFVPFSFAASRSSITLDYATACASMMAIDVAYIDLLSTVLKCGQSTTVSKCG